MLTKREARVGTGKKVTNGTFGPWAIYGSNMWPVWILLPLNFNVGVIFFSPPTIRRYIKSAFFSLGIEKVDHEYNKIIFDE